jgi:hypothetical protein
MTTSKKPSSFANEPKGASVPGREPDEFLDADVPPGHSPDTAPAEGFAEPVVNIHPDPALVEETKVYKLLSADATIDGVKYSTHFTDHGGHYGLFTLTEKQADKIEGDGWKLVEVGGGDDFSVHPEAAKGEENEDEFLHPKTKTVTATGGAGGRGGVGGAGGGGGRM